MNELKDYYYNRTYELFMDCFIKVQELSKENNQLIEIYESMSNALNEFKILNYMDKVAEG